MTDKEYKALREKCINKFSVAYDHSFVFQALRVDQETITRLMKDKEYLLETKAILAELHIEHLASLNKVMSGDAENEAKGSSAVIMKAIQMQREILTLDVEKKDNETTLNVTFQELSKEDMEENPNITVFIPDEKKENNL